MLPRSAASAHRPHCGPHHCEANAGPLVRGALGPAGASEGDRDACSAQDPITLLLHLMTPDPMDTGCKKTLGPLSVYSMQLRTTEPCGWKMGGTDPTSNTDAPYSHTPYWRPPLSPGLGCQPHCSPEAHLSAPLRAPFLETISQDCWGSDMRRERRGHPWVCCGPGASALYQPSW